MIPRTPFRTRDIRQAYAAAYKCLRSRDELRDRPATVVFDIDDTLLRANDGSMPRINLTIKLLHAAQRRGYNVEIVTARPEFPSNRAWTMEQLRARGIRVPESKVHLYDEKRHRSVSHYKSTRRRAMRPPTEGTVGDALHDVTPIHLEGGAATKAADENTWRDHREHVVLRLNRRHDGAAWGWKLPEY